MYCEVLRKGSSSSVSLLIQAAFSLLPPLLPPHALSEATKQGAEGGILFSTLL